MCRDSLKINLFFVIDIGDDFMIELDEDILSELRPLFLEMLLEVDRICRKHDIKYSLDSGTLIGAVRHGGFIPWDADADVSMLRSEYEKFFEVCKTELNTEKFFLQDFRTDKEYRWGFPKIRYNDTVLLCAGQECGRWHPGVFVDIFVYDGVPDNYFLRRLHLFVCYCIRKGLYSVFGQYNANSILLRYWYKLLYAVPRDAWVWGFNQMVNISNRHKHQLARHLTYPYLKETKQGMPRKYGMPRVCFDEYQDMIFEKHVFKVFKNYDYYLRSMYDDYMTLPPIDERRAEPLSVLKLPGQEIIR